MAQSIAFEALAQLRGKAYLAERDRFFKSQPELLSNAQAYLLNDDWRLRIQAKIIQGWTTEHGFYRNLMSELNAVNVEKQRKTVVGISGIWDQYALRTKQEYHEKILPLAWEVITKFYDHQPDWKVITFLHMIGAFPVEESIEPTLYLLEEAQSPALKSAAGQALAKLPHEAVKKRLVELEGKHQAVLRAIQETRDRYE